MTVSRRGCLLGAAAASWAAGAPARIPREAVIPAALTPFDGELRIDRRQFRRQIEWMASIRGISGIMVNGAAGQDRALSREERRMLLGEALAAARGRVAILAALRETPAIPLAALAGDAVAEKADAVVVMPPPDPGGLQWEGARERFARVFDAGPPPVALYHTAYSTEVLTRLAALEPVFAVKEGSNDPAVFERNLRAIRALGRGVAVWSTNSRWLLADLATGADGILSGMGSVVADWHVDLAEAVRRSNLASARRVNDRLFPLTQVFYAAGGDAHSRMKYALKRLGRWESDAVRPPLRRPDAAECARIDEALRAGGLLG